MWRSISRSWAPQSLYWDLWIGKITYRLWGYLTIFHLQGGIVNDHQFTASVQKGWITCEVANRKEGWKKVHRKRSICRSKGFSECLAMLVVLLPELGSYSCLLLTYYGHVNTGSLNSTSHLLWVTCYCTQENTAWDSAQSALVTANFVFYNQLFTICKVGICMIRKQGLSKLT